MLNKYLISIVLILNLFLFEKIYGQKKYEDFAQTYSGMGALSEVIMSHKCLIRNNFNLFYESTIQKSEINRTLIWYKLVFHQPCFISFTIIPNNETDRYELEIYRVKENVNICDTNAKQIFTKIDSISKKVTYNDNFQSNSFRGSLFDTKQIPVTYNEAIYILVHNISGPDMGHVIDLQSCDYSYVLKVNKEKIEDEATEKRNELETPSLRLFSIANKICNTSKDSKLGYSNFLDKQMTTKNYNSSSLDSASKIHQSLIKKYDSIAGQSAPKNTDLNNLPINTIPAKIAYNKEKTYPDIFIKLDGSKNDSIKNVFQLKDSIFDIISKQDLPNDNSKNNSPKKIKPPKKPKEVYFSIIDANTKKIIPNPKLKLSKKSNSKNDILIYHDTICSYSAEFLISNKWILKCDTFGYLPYKENFNYDRCIKVDSLLYYLILISPLKKGDKLALPNVFFFPNSTVLKQNSYAELDKLVDYLNANPAKISINGHTMGNNRIDNIGNSVEEQFKFKGSAAKLSKKRAEKVYNYLIEKGIAEDRLLIKGYAGRKPIIKHPKNKAEREQNMRVEVKIIDIQKKYSSTTK